MGDYIMYLQWRYRIAKGKVQRCARCLRSARVIVIVCRRFPPRLSVRSLGLEATAGAALRLYRPHSIVFVEPGYCAQEDTGLEGALPRECVGIGYCPSERGKNDDTSIGRRRLVASSVARMSSLVFADIGSGTRVGGTRLGQECPSAVCGTAGGHRHGSGPQTRRAGQIAQARRRLHLRISDRPAGKPPASKQLHPRLRGHPLAPIPRGGGTGQTREASQSHPGELLLRKAQGSAR